MDADKSKDRQPRTSTTTDTRSETSTGRDSSTARSNPASRSYIRESSGRPKLTLVPPWAALNEVQWSPTQQNEKAKVSPTSPNSNPGAADQAQSGDLNLSTGDGKEAQHGSGKRAQDLTSASHHHHHTGSDDGWWTFTLPARARQKLENYWAGQETASDGKEFADLEKNSTNLNEKQGNGGIGGDSDFSHAMLRARHGGLGELSANHAQTPGWSTPWTPFRRQSWNPWDRPDAGHPVEGPDDPRLHQSLSQRRHNLITRFQQFLLTSPFAPFWLRFCNLLFACTTLALAARIIATEKRANEEGIIGISTIVALVIAPLSIVHIIFALWFEYFGAPIGVWSVRSKMLHTLSELVFIALWAAELSLAFDAYFTSPARCSAFTPYAKYATRPVATEGTPMAYLCDLQAALIAMVFISLMLYQAVIIVSLFRIFRKVSTRR